MFKRVLFFMFLCYSMILHSQSMIQPRIYAGVEAFNRKLFFNDEGYYGVTLGTELLQYKFLAPEVELSFYVGVIEKNDQLDITNLPGGYQAEAPMPVGYTTGGFNAMTYSFSPKLIFGDKDFAFIIIPKYSLSNINSYANYYKLNTLKGEYERNEREEANSSQSYFSLGLGFESGLFETEKLAMNLYLQYSFFDTRSAFKPLKVEGLENDQGTKAIGVGVKLYYDPWNK